MNDSKNPKNSNSENLDFAMNYLSIYFELDDIKEHLKEFKSHIDKTNNKELKELSSELIDIMGGQFEETHGKLLKYSLIISLFILLEIEIRKFIESFKLYGETKLNFSEVNGDLLKKFRIFSKKILELNFDFDSDLWQYLNGLQEVRNCLIHSGGYTRNYPKRKQIENFINNEKSITIDQFDDLNISFDTCSNAINRINEFFLTITECAFQKFPGKCKVKNGKIFTSK